MVYDCDARRFLGIFQKILDNGPGLMWDELDWVVLSLGYNHVFWFSTMYVVEHT